MEYSPYSLLMDLAFASGFILIGQLLRAKVRIFQEFFLPASLLAGALGFVFGPGVLNLIPFSGKIGSYAGILIILVFVSVGIRGLNLSTKGLKGDVKRIGSYLCFRESCYILQYTVPILFSLYVLGTIFPGLHPGFGFLLGCGWAGGPGTAVAVGTTFANYGWADAKDLAVTSATLGTLTSIFGGIILIKWATSRGITNYISDFGSLPQELRTGLIPAEKRESIGKAPLAEISLDSIAWHLALMMLPAGLGWQLANYVGKNYGIEIPSFSAAFLLALAFSTILGKVGAKKYIDFKVTSSIAGTATDYLVFFAMTSIKVAVIVKYAAPLAMLMLFGAVWIIGTFLVLAPRLNERDWFERGIFVFGYLTGVYATGFILSRIVDPEMKSKTFDDTAICAPLTTPTDITVLSLGPILLSTGAAWTFLTPAFGYLFAFLLLATVMKWWSFNMPLVRKHSDAA